MTLIREIAPPMSVAPERRARPPAANLVLLYAVLTLGALMVVLPLLLIALNSLKSSAASANVELTLPAKYHFSNYTDVLRHGGVLRAMGNGAFISGCSIVVVVSVASSAAFVLARSKARSASLIRGVLAIGLLAPLQVIPEIKVVQALGISGSYSAIILIDAASWIPFAIFLYSGFIRGLPIELEEAATLDGCGPLRVFFRVVFPLLKPVTSTLVVLLFTGIWNDFQVALYFINNQQMYTMPLTLFSFSGLHTYDYNLVCADIMLTILPVMAVFFFAQRYIVSGLVAGATK